MANNMDIAVCTRSASEAGGGSGSSSAVVRGGAPPSSETRTAEWSSSGVVAVAFAATAAVAGAGAGSGGSRSSIAWPWSPVSASTLDSGRPSVAEESAVALAVSMEATVVLAMSAARSASVLAVILSVELGSADEGGLVMSAEVGDGKGSSDGTRKTTGQSFAR